MVLLVRPNHARASQTLLNDLARSILRLLEGRPRGAKALISGHPLILRHDVIMDSVSSTSFYLLIKPPPNNKYHTDSEHTGYTNHLQVSSMIAECQWNPADLSQVPRGLRLT